jgi:YgiT-type zinc finger domain-containing protein
VEIEGGGKIGGSSRNKEGRMSMEDFDREWEKLSEEVLTGMKEWRLQHPRATLSEMEAALDERLARMRARMLEDMALASRAANWKEEGIESKPVCPHCGATLVSRGRGKRHLQTQGGEEIKLKRGYGVCPKCGEGFFPPG